MAPIMGFYAAFYVFIFVYPLQVRKGYSSVTYDKRRFRGLLCVFIQCPKCLCCPMFIVLYFGWHCVLQESCSGTGSPDG